MILDKQDKDSVLRIAVLASGRGSNFEALCNGDTGNGRISLLITDNEKADVLRKASALGVEALYMSPGRYRTKFGEAEEREWAQLMKDRGIELICLAGLMRIIKGPILEEYQDRIMNIHPSLLPSFPGLHAQKQALDYGVRITGCTVHYVDAGVDSGPIVLQKAVHVKDDDTVETLSGRILQQEHIAYSEAVRLYCSGVIASSERYAYKREQ
ncbi:MAG: phosphoribosylglycinamide formyltransferase [Candidatus Aegiribacteria sp.]|nr:phosphoribosylglycinamide formyltransferase [Candidatus Aegiribacteria sp.]